MWILTGEKDLEGEYTPTDSMNDYLDWFVKPVDDGGHGGPMIINHTNKVVGHWYKHGTATHPETGKEAKYIEGIVHRGPDGKPFYNGDRLWNNIKEGTVKGTSWGGTIVSEEKTLDNFGFQQEATNEKVQPYEISIVTDWDGQEHTPALPNATPILINENAKTMKTEVHNMPDENPVEETKEEEPTEETKEDTFDAQKAIEDLTAKFTEFVEQVKGGAYPMSNADKKDEEEEDSEGKEKEADKEEDEPEDEEKTEEVKEEVMVFPDEWKDTVKTAVEEKMKEFLSTIEKVETPQPPQEPVEKEKTTKPLYEMTSEERMAYFRKQTQE